ncbi:peptidase M76 family-domain-containing protein [Blastocladiella britannica]|nr:peptidase M76 family-domain-containing protein [Blastocladiella britannica]
MMMMMMDNDRDSTFRRVAAVFRRWTDHGDACAPVRHLSIVEPSSAGTPAAPAPAPANLILPQSDRNPLLEQARNKQCNMWKTELLATDPKIQRLMDALAAHGCAFDPEKHIRCMPCSPVASGGFGAEFGILLCQNQIFRKEHMRETLIHELVHAYDHCVFKYRWTDCKHFACTEVRAANVSGDCQFSRELERGNFAVIGGQMQCVKRRAILATKHNPLCKDQAEAAVNAVFDSCYGDRQPFDNAE